MPLHPRKSIGVRVFLILLAGLGVYGAYFGYCRYKMGERIYAFDQEAQDLQQAMMRLVRTVGRDDLYAYVINLAAKHDLAVEPDLKISVEPLTPETQGKLPAVAQMGLGMAAKIAPGKQLFVIGFQARLTAKQGMFKRTFDSQRYTWFEWARP